MYVFILHVQKNIASACASYVHITNLFTSVYMLSIGLKFGWLEGQTKISNQISNSKSNILVCVLLILNKYCLLGVYSYQSIFGK